MWAKNTKKRNFFNKFPSTAVAQGGQGGVGAVWLGACPRQDTGFPGTIDDSQLESRACGAFMQNKK